ncbi:MAG: PD-(D/E)XK nuclease family protein [Bacillus sp. (in: firmicutes)]
MGELFFTAFQDIASQERLNDWYQKQSMKQKPLYYILPSSKWFRSARKLQPGIAYQTFDDLATLILQTASIPFTPITEDDRYFFFYDILNQTNQFLSENLLSKKAKAYNDSYGQLKRLGFPVEDTPAPLEKLKEVFYTYEEIYQDGKGFFDPENRIGKAVEVPISKDSFPLSHVVIDGYVDFSPVQYKMIDYLLMNNIPVTIYLPALDTPIIAETAAALKRMGMSIQQESIPTIEPMLLTSSVSAATTIEEEIHGALESIHTKKTNSFQDFAIVLANETAYLPVLERISEEKQIPIKRAKKLPLSDSILFSFLHLALEKNETPTKWDQVPLVDMLAKLCFLTPTDFNTLKAAFIHTEELVIEEISSLMEKTKSFQWSLPEKASISDYINELVDFLASLELFSFWNKKLLDGNKQESHQIAFAIRSLKRTTELLQKQKEEDILPTSKIIVSIETFKEKLLVNLEEESLFIDRAPTEGIEIFSFRDVPLFKGKHLFVLGLNEGEFPKQHSLSGYFQERYVENVVSPYPLPLAAYFIQKDDAAFEQLKYLAENITFSFVQGMNPHQPLLASKYLMDKEVGRCYSHISRLINDTYQSNKEYEEKISYHIGIGKVVPEPPVVISNFAKNVQKLQSRVEKISEKWQETLRSNSIAITSLERYAGCSFLYGMERVLQVNPPVAKQFRLDPIQTGSMMHRIVEQFYRGVKGVSFKDLVHHFKNREEEILLELFEKEWSLIVHAHKEIPFNSLQKAKEEWIRRFRRWLAAEKRRFWDNEELQHTSIYQLEESIQLKIELANNHSLTVTGKIDRIDVDEHGFMIYDYKSSNKSLDFDNEIPAGLVLQIPLYLMALENKYTKANRTNNQPVGGGYISIKQPHIRKKNMVWRDEQQKARFEPARIRTNILPVHREALEEKYGIANVIEELWRGTFADFSIQPFSEQVCTYCNYQPICRIRTELS